MKKGNPAQTLRKDAKDALARLWPDGIVEMSVDYENSWFLKLRPNWHARSKG